MGNVGTRLAAPLALAVAALLAAGPAFANDSSSELAAGGIVLTKSEKIAMQREDLSLSPQEVRVRYEFRNDTSAPVTLRVAFPMPEVPKDTPGGMETTGTHNIDMMPPSDPNFLQFRVWSDGAPVTPQVDVYATLPGGRDVTEALKQVGGMPLVLHPRYFELPSEADKRGGPNGGWDLDAAARKKLQDLGALKQDAEDYDTTWSTRVVFHWHQVFKPGVTVIEHSYRPILGSQLFGSERRGALGQADAEHGVWKGSADEDLAKAFCIDAGTDKAMRAVYRRLIAKRQAEMKGQPVGDGYFSAYTLAYILKTARNWHGPIGTFHLTLAGGRMVEPYADAGEVRLMSLCTDLPLRMTAPMRFEATVSNYVPKDDIRVLILAE